MKSDLDLVSEAAQALLEALPRCVVPGCVHVRRFGVDRESPTHCQEHAESAGFYTRGFEQKWAVAADALREALNTTSSLPPTPDFWLLAPTSKTRKI